MTILAQLACLAAVSLATAGAPQPVAPDVPWLDPEEVAKLLADLVEEGLVPTQLDLEALGLAPVAAESADRDGPGGRWRTELVRREDASCTAQVRLDRDHGPLTFRLRGRRDGEAPAVWGGCLRAGGGGVTVAAGGIALAHGFGLMAAAAGRRPGASVDGSLLAPAAGVRTWSSPVGEGLRGVAGDLRRGPVEVGVLAARATAGGALVRQGRVAVVLTRLAVAVCGATDATRQATSVSATLRCGPLTGQGEVARGRAAGNLPWSTALVAAARYQAAHTLVEVQTSQAAAASGPWLGIRPESLSGWDGRGWCARGRHRLRGGVTIALLAAGSEHRPEITRARDREVRSGVEAAVRGHWGEQRSWEARWRHALLTRWTHDDSAPWLPPSETRRDQTEQIVLEAGAPLEGGRLTTTMRSVSRAGTVASGRRTLLTAAWRTRSARWRWTLAGGWAWGDPVALSTAIAPVSGLVVARAWGAWASEVVVGCEGRVASLRWQVAMARRQAAGPSPAATARWQAWWQLGGSW